MNRDQRAAQPHLGLPPLRGGLHLAKPRQGQVKYGVRQDITFAPWAASMRPGYLDLLGDDELGQAAVDMLASQLAPGSYKTYGTGVRSFAAFCAEAGVPDILEATPKDIVRYLAWLQERGTVGGQSLQVYLSVINTLYRDHLREPVALGPLVTAARQGYLPHQVLLVAGPKRVYLPAAVAYSILEWAEQLLSPGLPRSAIDAALPLLRAAVAVLVNYIFFARGGTGVLADSGDLVVTSDAIILFKRHGKGLRGVLVDRLPVVQVPSGAHAGRVSALIRTYLAVRQACCAASGLEEPGRLWQLPDEVAANWTTAATMTTWLQTCCCEVRRAPPDGFTWTSHSLRSGAASAASAVLVPMTKIRHYGGWSAASTVVEKDYIDPGCPADAPARFFFSWLSLTPVEASAPAASSQGP